MVQNRNLYSFTRKNAFIERANRTYLLSGQCILLTLDIPLVGECIRTGSGMNS